ncbi:hypothetical protein [Acidovorax sp. BL-A-41-H1]|uniref:hypothetical protein n=1 Tax=Acidovorax sp. BL-A-41-H1 TaxID=3421102 RepID=UPI003F79BBA7
MKNVHATFQQLLRIPGAPPPITEEQMRAAHADAWAQVQHSEANDPRIYRALQDQQQYLHSTGVLS